jgi:glycosyltransferase involved in cell wall biosynthesis
MTIAVNGFYFRHKPTGIANVMINAINNLSKRENIHIVLFCSRQLPLDIYRRLKIEKITIIIKKIPLVPDIGMLWFLFLLPFLVNQLNPDILWCPAVWKPLFINKRIKALITINDFVSKDYKNTMRLSNRFFHFLLEKRSINKASFIWAISEYTKNKTELFYPNRNQKEIFAGCASDSSLFYRITISQGERKSFCDKFNIKKDFLLYVGTLEPRKNVKFLLELFNNIKKKYDVQLVVVGIKGWGKTGIDDIIHNDDYPYSDIIIPGFISEQELLYFYNLAQCYISSSLNEGFGLPQIEAMYCGCPVISPHNSAMIEVVYEAGVTVSGWDVDVWLSKIDWLFENREAVIERQNKKIKKYRWDKIIDDLLAYLRKPGE